MQDNLILHLLVIGFLLNGCQTEKQRSADEWFKQGLLFAKAQRYENAINSFTKALEINPRYAKTYNQRGIILGKKVTKLPSPLSLILLGIIPFGFTF